MLILNADDVRATLPIKQAIEATKQAFAALSSGQAELPLRTRLTISAHNGASLIMPAYLHTEQTEALAVKTVSVFPDNPARGLPFIHAAVLALDPTSGRPLALLEGGTLTAIRTGAASGAATDLLARPDANTVAIFGAGVQGRTQLAAVCAVREIETAWIFDPDRARAQAFVEALAGKGRIPADLRVADDPAEAARPAAIICTATTSMTPVYPAAAIQPGTHINGIGSYTPEMRENPPEIYRRARAFADSREAVLAESGEITAAIQRGLLHPEEITELGEVILGQRPGRTTTEQITFFKSVGVAVQDAIAARLALDNALTMGRGARVAW